MSILDKLLPSRRAKKSIQLHPNASYFGSLVTDFLAGAEIVVLNPNTNQWEDCPNPIFDPQYHYAHKHPRVAVAPPPQVTAPVAPVQPPDPVEPVPTAPVQKFKRGQIWQAADGAQYLILGNKRELVPGYTLGGDPDAMLLVMVRYDQGMKRTVTHRISNGIRPDNGAKNLVTAVGSLHLTTPTVKTVTGEGDVIRLYVRQKDKKTVYLRVSNGETIIR